MGSIFTSWDSDPHRLCAAYRCRGIALHCRCL